MAGLFEQVIGDLPGLQCVDAAHVGQDGAVLPAAQNHAHTGFTTRVYDHMRDIHSAPLHLRQHEIPKQVFANDPDDRHAQTQTCCTAGEDGARRPNGQVGRIDQCLVLVEERLKVGLESTRSGLISPATRISYSLSFI